MKRQQESKRITTDKKKKMKKLKPYTENGCKNAQQIKITSDIAHGRNE
jgi:hypothetical protein